MKGRRLDGSRHNVADRRPLVLFAMSHAGFIRNFRDVLLRLCDNGADVHIVLSKAHETITLADYDLSVGRGERITTEIAGSHELDPPAGAERLRIMRDIIQYIRPEYDAAADLRARFLDHQKDALSSKAIERFVRVFRLLRLKPGGGVDRMLRRAERRILPNAKVDAIVDRLRPDVVIATPITNFASREVDFFKSAHRRGIPTVLPVASWDNLTNKGVMKFLPDRVLVWNEVMQKEAEQLHGVPSSRIRVTGAAVFDGWFDRRPSADRADFCARLGFDADSPMIAYMCSSQAIAGNSEPKLVMKWARAVLAFFAQRNRRVNILVRPHPMHKRPWTKFLANLGGRDDDFPCIYPLDPIHPSTEESRAIFFDTLYHCSAVVGLNTSTMIEAAILRKPVLTFLDHPLANSQAGNLHFQHLQRDGMLLQSETIDDHLIQLERALGRGSDTGQRCGSFVSSFVRPLGLSVAASGVICDEIFEAMGYRSALQRQCVRA